MLWKKAASSITVGVGFKENTEGRTKEDIKALTWDLNDANNQAWQSPICLVSHFRPDCSTLHEACFVQ